LKHGGIALKEQRKLLQAVLARFCQMRLLTRGVAETIFFSTKL